jgi:hypothetical protein|tara:strand:- start:448 stop:660 length:213 start_codon:yes stop_codon:yes gene_type:complete
MKMYLVTDWEFKYNNIYTTKEEVYTRIFEGEYDENFNVKKKMKEISWELLKNRYDYKKGGEITIEEYNVN